MAGRSQRAELAPVHLPGLCTNAAVSGTNSISALVSGVVARRLATHAGRLRQCASMFQMPPGRRKYLIAARRLHPA